MFRCNLQLFGWVLLVSPESKSWNPCGGQSRAKERSEQAWQLTIQSSRRAFGARLIEALCSQTNHREKYRKISGLFDEEAKKEAKRHNDFLNSGFGLITFTFAFTCLGFKNTQKLALACLPVVIGLLLQERNHFPSTLKVIRVLEKELKIFM